MLTQSSGSSNHPAALNRPLTKKASQSVQALTFPYHTEDKYDFTREEVNLASRCHGFPLEALDLDVTPTGMHYLLIHFDIPMISPNKYRLKLSGLFQRKLELSLEDPRRRPRVSIPVTMECAGNGRTNMKKRYAACQPAASSQKPTNGVVYLCHHPFPGIGLMCRGRSAPSERQCGPAPH